MKKRNTFALVVLALLLIVVIVMNMGGDTDSAEVRPVAEGSVQAPGLGIKIGKANP